MRDNIILFMGSIAAGVFGFIFHFYMGRILGPADYSILGVILSIIYIMSIGLNTLQMSITKFVSNFNAKKEYSKISYLINRSLKKLTAYGTLLLLLFVIITPLLSKFLHITITPLLIIAPCVIFLMILPINRGSLQGLQRFKGLSFNLVIEGTVKLLGGILLVLLGLGVKGAILSIVLSYLIAFFASFYPLKDIMKNKKEKFDTKEIYSFSLPVLIGLVSLTLMYSIDLILVKHFFSPIEAGYYAAVSLLAKILFFGTMSISQVMFPKVSELYYKNKEHKHLLYKSIFIALIIIVPSIIIFYIFPKLIVTTLFGEKFLEIIPYVGPFSVVIGLFSLIYLITFYNLSINKKNFLIILVFFNILQILLIVMFHSSLMQIINILMFYMASLLIIMFFLTALNKKWLNYQ